MKKGLEYNVQTQTLTEVEIPEEQIALEEKYDKINDFQNTINLKKSQISDTDYKIIKCYEYSLVGLELPYDIQELHKARQDMRDEINALETAISQLKEGE